MKKRNSKYPVLSKFKKPTYNFIEFDFSKTKVVRKDDIKDKWPLINIDEVTVYHFLVEVKLGNAIREEPGITCYDSVEKVSYSLNGIAKESTGYPFPYEAGICKRDDDGNYMDIEVLK